MKRTLFIAAFAFALALSVAGCSSSKEMETLPAEVRYAQAMAKFNNEDYLEAADDFKIVTVQYPGSALADSAQFHIAECRYRRGEYILAASECDLLVRTMPSSPLVPRARYMKAMSDYDLSPKSELDQKYTREAIDDFQAFLEYSPNDSLAREAAVKIIELNNKLAKKEYENGVLYFRLEYYKSAIAYFDNVMDRYHDSEYADDALLGKARAMRERHDLAGALDAINLFYQKYPASDLLPVVNSLKSDITTEMANAPPPSQKTAGLSSSTRP